MTQKDSIRNAVKAIKEKEGKLHILVNKHVLFRRLNSDTQLTRASAGQVGPFSIFFNDESAPEHADIGTAVFENDQFADWGSLFDVSARL